MTLRKDFYRLLGLLILSLFIFVQSYGESLDDIDALTGRTNINVQYTLEALVTYSGPFSTYMNANGQSDKITFSGSPFTWAKGSIDSLSLTVGKTYLVSFTNTRNLAAILVTFDVPTGYTVWIDGDQRRNTTGSGSGYSLYLTVTGPEEKRVAFGEADTDSVNRVNWLFGLGKTAGDEDAGYLSLKASSISSSLYSAAALDVFSSSSEVVVTESGGIITKVEAPQGVVDIVSVSQGFELRYKPNGSTSYAVVYKVSNGGSGGLKITETRGSVSYEKVLSQSGYDWEMEHWHDASNVTNPNYTQYDYISSTQSKGYIRNGNTNAVVEQVTINYMSAPFGKEIKSIVRGTTNPMTTSNTYYGSGALGVRGKVHTTTLACGNKVTYDYYDIYDFDPGAWKTTLGEIATTISPFKDGNVTASSDDDDDFHITAFSYFSYGEKVYLESAIEQTQGQITTNLDSSFTSTTFDGTAGLVIDSDEHGTINQYTQGDELEGYRTYSQISVDGSQRSYVYQYGSYSHGNRVFVPDDDGNYIRVVKVNGLDPSISDPMLSVAPFSGKSSTINVFNDGSYSTSIDGIKVLSQFSTAEILVLDPAFQPVLEETRAFYGGNFSNIVSQVAHTYSDMKLTKTQRVDKPSSGSSSSLQTLYDATYTNGRLTQEIDASGVVTQYTYDDYGRQRTVTKLGVSGGSTIEAQENLIVTYSYNAADNVTSKVISSGASGFTETLTYSNTYDDAGRLSTSIDPGSLITSFSYNSCSKKVTITYPGGATKTVDYYKDGQLKSITGTAQPAVEYDYAINSASGSEGNLIVSEQFSATGQWKESETDLFGRVVRQTVPGYGTEADIDLFSFYDSRHRLIRQETKAGTSNVEPVKYFEYSPLNELFRSGVDLNEDSSLDTADDFVQQQYNFFSYIGTDWYHETRTGYYHDDTSSVSRLREEVIYHKLTNPGVNVLKREGRFQKVYTDSSSYLLNSTNTVSVNRTSKLLIDKLDRQVYKSSSGGWSNVDTTQTYENGLKVLSNNDYGHEYEYHYDELGRLESTEDPRLSGATDYQYQTNTAWVSHVVTPDGMDTYYNYESATGRLSYESNELGKATRYKYNDFGKVTHVWGDVPNPTKYEYDSLGRLSFMRTYRNGTWTSSTLPSGFSSRGDTTKWIYDSETGLLRMKEDADEIEVRFIYDDSGRLKQRTSGRGTVTKYHYYDDSNSGTVPFNKALKMIEYTSTSHETDDVEFEYNRIGQLTRVTDGTGARTFAYDDEARLIKETLGSSYGTGSSALSLNYEYDDVDRVDNFELLKGTSTSYLEDGFTYGTDGRLASVTAQGTTLNYSYLTNSLMVDNIASGSYYKRQYAYESDSNRLSSIETTWNTSAKRGKFSYTYDALGRVDKMIQSGSIVESLTGYSSTGYNWQEIESEYNDRHELIESSTVKTDDGLSPVSLADRFRDFGYDAQGNRTDSTTSTTVTSYSTNFLNQYTNVGGVSNNHDSDGNLVRDDDWTYQYDSENRLVKMIRRADTDDYYKFEYDYLGRRTYKEYVEDGVSDYKLRYVYNGWLLVAEFDATTNARLRSYSYGLGAADGTGALLLVKDSGSEKFYPIYDGNGNIHGLMDVSGNLDAIYDYDAYGNLIHEQGAKVDSCSLRYSTKYWDYDSTSGTGLLYYGQRYYDPETGRFLNRDPIGEKGGNNLYSFTMNNPVNRWDFLGLDPGFGDRAGDPYYIGLNGYMVVNQAGCYVTYRVSTDVSSGQRSTTVVGIDCPTPFGAAPWRWGDNSHREGGHRLAGGGRFDQDPDVTPVETSRNSKVDCDKLRAMLNSDYGILKSWIKDQINVTGETSDYNMDRLAGALAVIGLEGGKMGEAMVSISVYGQVHFNLDSNIQDPGFSHKYNRIDLNPSASNFAWSVGPYEVSQNEPYLYVSDVVMHELGHYVSGGLPDPYNVVVFDKPYANEAGTNNPTRYNGYPVYPFGFNDNVYGTWEWRTGALGSNRWVGSDEYMEKLGLGESIKDAILKAWGCD